MARRNQRLKKRRADAEKAKPDEPTRVESWLRRQYRRHSHTVAVAVAVLATLGWGLDRTFFREAAAPPAVQYYEKPAEELPPSLRSYFQFPQYKEATINFGGALRFPNSHTISTQKIGADSYLLLQLTGEHQAHAYNASQLPVPFSVEINHNGIRSLVTVERVKEQGLQIRTFRSIARPSK